jgi:hypothetical protein
MYENSHNSNTNMCTNYSRNKLCRLINRKLKISQTFHENEKSSETQHNAQHKHDRPFWNLFLFWSEEWISKWKTHSKMCGKEFSFHYLECFIRLFHFQRTTNNWNVVVDWEFIMHFVVNIANLTSRDEIKTEIEFGKKLNKENQSHWVDI